MPINVYFYKISLLMYFSGCRNPDLEFQCASGNECIPIYDMCNGIPQCQDGSDENPSECPGELSI